jgi:uncharacterized protein YqgC (DUF456 family)
MANLPLLEAVTFVLLLVGLAGCVLPVLPGSPLMWLAYLLYYGVGWLQGGFEPREGAVLLLAGLIAAVGTTAEWWLSGYIARRGGASRKTTVMALAAGLIALVFLPFGGVTAIALAVVLPAATVFLLEYRRDRDSGRSAKAGCGYVTGWALATAVELGAGISLLALWLWQLGAR